MSEKNESQKVEIFFDGYSNEFDSIYDDKKNNFLNRYINKKLRKAMFGRYEITINKILENKVNKKILDIGCGTGRYCFKLAENGHEVLGIDMANSMIEAAKKVNANYLGKKVSLQVADYFKFNVSNVFDYAILCGFFDYIQNPIQVFNKLKNDTKIVLASFPKKFHWLTPQRALRYKLRNCPLYFYTKADIDNLMKNISVKQYKIIDNDREFFLICEF